jgi:hypothetical protein
MKDEKKLPIFFMMMSSRKVNVVFELLYVPLLMVCFNTSHYMRELDISHYIDVHQFYKDMENVGYENNYLFCAVTLCLFQNREE